MNWEYHLFIDIMCVMALSLHYQGIGTVGNWSTWKKPTWTLGLRPLDLGIKAKTFLL